MTTFTNRPGADYELQRLRDQLEHSEHELHEAFAEIRRHHELIVKLRDGLKWALDALHGLDPVRDREQFEGLQALLNREVG